MSHSSQHAGADHGTTKSYITGFILSVILTVIPFWIVMEHVLSPAATIGAIVVLAFIQVIVQLGYFLHMNTRSEGGWNFISLVFSAVIIAILVVGSLWIMHHLNINMMGM